jgi:hypothetical protein
MSFSMKMNDSLLKVSFHSITIKDLIIDPNVRDYCLLPYPDHPHGCPNYGKSPLCPPQSVFHPLSHYEPFSSFHLAICQFNLETYCEERRRRFPKSTDKALRNPRLYQAHVKKIFHSTIDRFIEVEGIDTYEIFGCGSGHKNAPSMESVGLHPIRMMQNLGINVELRPNNRIHFAALICVKKHCSGLWAYVKKAEVKS